MFHHFCKSARSASRQRENFVESLHSDGSATYLLIIWVEKMLTLGMKSKQKLYPSIIFLSIAHHSSATYIQSSKLLAFFSLTVGSDLVGNPNCSFSHAMAQIAGSVTGTFKMTYILMNDSPAS